MRPSVHVFPSNDHDLDGDVRLCTAALGDQTCADLLQERLKSRWPRVRVVERTELAELGPGGTMLYVFRDGGLGGRAPSSPRPESNRR